MPPDWNHMPRNILTMSDVNQTTYRNTWDRIGCHNAGTVSVFSKRHEIPILVILLLFLLTSPCCRAGTYMDSVSIYKDLVLNSDYSPDVRPIGNQSQILYVCVYFELLAIVEVNDVTQTFTCNGFLWMSWINEVRFRVRPVMGVINKALTRGRFNPHTHTH
ncbi:neuronal acetylcholine receptor subunit alpha-7 [Plakobranchus ocellatus]|uniref:Neuronal acetylcholine receptor subunit alpha-7 n=1 Tax=Plakobranchus ocellatus TaxID=259542 RepID=A0AAV3ZWL4_9GAST|nr:neuronal acetylcholine receptor subunit alpha-7 [Plakobranchus ocellatus]